MKTALKRTICYGVCVLTTATAAAQSEYPELLLPTGRDTTNQVQQTSQTRDADESQKFTRSKNLIGADVKGAQGNKLGDIDELLINPRNGEVFASIGISGDRYAIVPLQALKVSAPAGLLRNAEVTLNKTQQALESGPTIANDEWRKLDSPSFTRSIYSHYQVQQPSAMGGAGESSMGGTAEGSSLNSTNEHNSQQR